MDQEQRLWMMDLRMEEVDGDEEALCSNAEVGIGNCAGKLELIVECGKGCPGPYRLAGSCCSLLCDLFTGS